jgi:arylsulfatase A-like enzyme
MRAVTALLAVLWALSGSLRAAERPNVVHFVIDELGYYELSGMGHPDHRTPNIDRLAAEGLRFTQCLAGGPVCAPTRCALMTGKHAGHMTVRANGGFDPLREGEETIASVLKRAGYATGGFGKWGCGARGTSGVPEKHGFDLFFGYYDQRHAHTYFPRYLVRNSQEVPLPGNTGDTKKGQTFSHHLIVDEAKKFLRANRGRPFYAYLPWTPPHGRFGLPADEPSWALYRDKPWPEDAKIYAAMVNMVDRQVGEVRALLAELGVDKNTLILFSGDNGGLNYFRGAGRPDGLFQPNTDPRTGVKFRGFKGDLYEGGLRVPFIAHWPGKVAAGGVTDHLCYFPDVLPTLAELAGAACPKDVDGISLVPELLGAAAAGRPQPRHEYLYWEHRQDVAVRAGNWKAVRRGGPAKPWELYDLSRDVSEAHDVAARHPEVVEKLKAFTAAAHTPAVLGQVYDRPLVEKDRNYLAEPAPMPGSR